MVEFLSSNSRKRLAVDIPALASRAIHVKWVKATEMATAVERTRNTPTDYGIESSRVRPNARKIKAYVFW